MRVGDKVLQTIWLGADGESVAIIDQRFLPYRLVVEELRSVDEMVTAIRDMHLRGAIVIGVADAFGGYLAAREARDAVSFEQAFESAAVKISSARPTAVNLAWGVEVVRRAVRAADGAAQKVAAALRAAEQVRDDELQRCRAIGRHGCEVLERLAARKRSAPLNILTHCNAGWLACVDYGTATAPIYEAFHKGLPLHVWVDETRPRNQGARLTAWELGQAGVPHTVIADNTGGHLMQHGLVDLVIVGADRVTRAGDAANKIGTYLKALAAFDNNVPFYVAFPSSTFDWSISDGVREITIEERDPDEVRFVEGALPDERHGSVRVPPAESRCANFGFDVTPRRLITGLITERGICRAEEAEIVRLYGEQRPQRAAAPATGGQD